MYEIILLNSQIFPQAQLKSVQYHLSSEFTNVIIKTPILKSQIQELIKNSNLLYSVFVLLNNKLHTSPELANRLSNQRVRYFIYNVGIMNHDHRLSSNLEELTNNLRHQIIYSKTKTNPKTKLNVSIAVIKSENSKFRYEIRELYKVYKANPRVQMYECSSFDNQFINKAKQLILLIHSQDISNIQSKYQQFIKTIPYERLVVIVYGECNPIRFKFDIKVSNYKQLETKTEWLVKESIYKIKMLDPRYEIVALEGDTVFNQFCKLLPCSYRIVQKLTDKEKRAIIIAPSSKLKNLTSHLEQYPYFTFGILATIQSNPLQNGEKYRHPSIKLATNNIKQCVQCIEQINEQCLQTKEKRLKRQTSQYNPAKANMWQRLENQIRNESARTKRQSRNSGRTSRILSSLNKQDPIKRTITSPNQYGLSSINKKSQPSTRLSSLIPSALAQKKRSKQDKQSSISIELSSIPSEPPPFLNSSQIPTNPQLNHINPLSNIENTFHQSSKQSKTHNMILCSKQQDYFPSCSGPIQLFFKTKNIYINKLQQYFTNSSKFCYKYQTINELKQCLRSSHQQMITLAIIDEQQMVQTMRLLAIFDNLYYLVVAPFLRADELKEKIHDSIGFIASDVPLNRTYKDVTAYIRLLKMRFYKTNDMDLKNYSNNLVDEKEQIGNIIYYSDRHVETLIKVMDQNENFTLREYKSLEDLQIKLQSSKQNSIVILNGYMASIANSLITRFNSTFKLIIFEPDQYKLTTKPLGVQLATTNKELINLINRLII